MREYVRPSAEMVTFVDEMIMTSDSGCNCHYDISSNTMVVNETTVDCEAETGDASENPFGVDAPLWTFG